MPLTFLSRAFAAGALLLAARPGLAAEDKAVPIVVLKEHGVGNQALAQPYLDRMVALAAKQNDWPAGSGKYFTSRGAAEAFIKSARPHYGILSLPAFLAMRKAYELDVIGRVAVSLAGGRRYYLISKTANNVADCKGQTLATDHSDDPHFIDSIVFAGDAKLDEFTLAPTQRPLQTIKAVMTDKARCALIDDAQKDQLEHLHDRDTLRAVWESDELPPMPVVAFRAAPKAERERFKRNLDAVCNGEGQSACAEVGIVDLTGADDAEYANLVKAYGK